MRASLGVAAITWVLVVTAACEKRHPGPDAGASAAPFAASQPSRAPVPAPVREPEAPEVALCRVIAARPPAGMAADAGTGASTPKVGTALEGRDWLDLSGPTEIVLRHASTTRELALRGPGRFLPCFLGSETVLVAHGDVTTTAGAGARAGAEVILATPFGTVHFADAALELRVRERVLETRVETGSATLVPAGTRADAGSDDVVLGPKAKRKITGKVEVSELLSACAEASSSIGSPAPKSDDAASARAKLGEWSVARLRARQAARWACAAARAAAGRQEIAEQERLWVELAKVDRVFKTGGK